MSTEQQAEKQRKTLQERGILSYEMYRLLLDKIYNAGATNKDHYELKQRVDDYVLTMIEHAEKKALEAQLSP